MHAAYLSHTCILLEMYLHSHSKVMCKLYISKEHEEVKIIQNASILPKAHLDKILLSGILNTIF